LISERQFALETADFALLSHSALTNRKSFSARIKMNFLFFGLFLVEFCSASRCRREKDRIKELYQQKRELRIERNELKEENVELKRKLEAFETTTTTTKISTTTTTTAEISTNMTKVIEPSDVFILVIPSWIDESYLQSGDGTSQISATINRYDPENNYANEAAFALVKGELHIFGGYSDGYKIARLDGCSFKELPARLNEERRAGHAAVSTENGQKALVCFGPYNSGDTKKSCEIFDGSSTATTFATEWTHFRGGLGLFKNQPATVGCDYAEHQKAETLLSTVWTALPDFPLSVFNYFWRFLLFQENFEPRPRWT